MLISGGSREGGRGDWDGWIVVGVGAGSGVGTKVGAGGDGGCEKRGGMIDSWGDEGLAIVQYECYVSQCRWHALDSRVHQ